MKRRRLYREMNVCITVRGGGVGRGLHEGHRDPERELRIQRGNERSVRTRIFSERDERLRE